MKELPLEELLRIEDPQKLRVQFLQLLQSVAGDDGYRMAPLCGESETFLHDRYRMTYLIGVVTDAEDQLRARLHDWGFAQTGHSHIHPYLRLHVHIIQVPGCDLGSSAEVQDGLHAWQPHQTDLNSIFDLLEERQPEIFRASSQSGINTERLYRESGQLEILGPQERRLHVGHDKIIAYLKQQGKLSPTDPSRDNEGQMKGH